MLSSYPVACPHEDCGWNGSLVPSIIRGGAGAEVAKMQRAWFQCPRCKCDWEVRINDDRPRVRQEVLSPKPLILFYDDASPHDELTSEANGPDIRHNL